ncbi:MAG: serine hydrolase domain-containing protein [Mycobacteriales bacterium]
MDVKIEVDPAEVGLDAARLQRLDRHLGAYVDDGRLAGWSMLVSRRGQVAHLSTYGRRDIENDLPLDTDTIFRIYSMTKPVTSVAIMMLVEEGLLDLKTPVASLIPSFGDLRVYQGGPATKFVTLPASQPMRLWHLLTHTSGLTYGFHHMHVTDEIYRDNGFEWGQPKELDLAGSVDAYAAMPLAFEPGAEWLYSVATDVLGRIVEVVSGQTLPEFFAARIFDPLGMSDTAFRVPETDADRLAALYVQNPQNGQALRYDVFGKAALRPVTAPSGGGGLVSTIGDYHRFTQMLRGRGAVDGVRLLGPRTIDAMRTNHLPGGADLTGFGRPLHAETDFDGVGFGLGFSTVLDAAATKVLTSEGQYGWGGAASTAFWVDPVEDMTMIFMTQLLPSSTYPLRPAFDTLVHAAIVD